MKSVIIPVFDQKDLAALFNCLMFLKNSGTQTIMILHNPNIGLNDGDISKPFESRMAELELAEQSAAHRRDYTAAQGYHQQYEDTKTERDTAIREGWSNIPKEELFKINRRALDPAKIGTEAIFPLKENYDHDQIFRALHELQSTWPKDLIHGEIAVVWPRSIAPQGLQAQAAPAMAPARFKVEAPAAEAPNEESRRKKLRMQGVFLGACKQHGLQHKGAKGAERDAIIDQIIAIEFPAAA